MLYSEHLWRNRIEIFHVREETYLRKKNDKKWEIDLYNFLKNDVKLVDVVP